MSRVSQRCSAGGAIVASADTSICLLFGSSTRLACSSISGRPSKPGTIVLNLCIGSVVQSPTVLQSFSDSHSYDPGAMIVGQKSVATEGPLHARSRLSQQTTRMDRVPRRGVAGAVCCRVRVPAGAGAEATMEGRQFLPSGKHFEQGDRPPQANALSWLSSAWLLPHWPDRHA